MVIKRTLWGYSVRRIEWGLRVERLDIRKDGMHFPALAVGGKFLVGRSNGRDGEATTQETVKI